MITLQQIIILSFGAVCAGCAPLAAHAQYSESPTRPGLYVGVQAVNYRYAFHYRNGLETVLALNPGQLTLGYAVSSQWALQGGLVVSRSRHHWTSSGRSLSGQALAGSYSDQSNTQALPLLVRYTLVGRPANRFHLDALLGPSFVHSQGKSEQTNWTDGIVTRHVQGSFSGWNTILTTGLGGRYAVGAHWQLLAEGGLSHNTSIRQSSVAMGGTDKFTTFMGLGAHYHFQTR